jgi:glycosyltransferase involved in cell wall biosynthesis/GT2 family glycosyltransferase
VITPSFNQGAFIEETILSVINQGYPALDYIVVDGNSTDNSLEILERYRRYFAHFIAERDDGQSNAINKGMALATGEILTWLNSDDMLTPDALFAAALAFDYSDADMIAGVCELQRAEQRLAYHMTSCPNGILSIQELLDLDNCWDGGHFFYQPEVLFRKTLWDRAGGQVRQDLYYSMDYELWLRFARAGAIMHVVGRPIAIHRQHEHQKTHVPELFKAELRKVRREYVGLEEDVEETNAPAVQARPHLRVALVNDVGFRYGAGIAQQRIAEAIAWAGHQVRSTSLIEAGVDRGGSVARAFGTLRAAMDDVDPDFVIFGNLHGAHADARLAGLCAQVWPTFIVLHDLWWLTGRCAYTQGCSKLLDGCDASCPTPDEYPQLERHRIAQAWRAKRQVLDGAKRPVLLGSSHWAADVARETLTNGAGRLTRVPAVEEFRIGVPTDVYRPRDMRMCRSRFGLPLDKFIVMISASTLGDRRKGAVGYACALNALTLPDLATVAAGRLEDETDIDIPHLHRVGYISTEEDMALLYGAADIFVGPSSAETFGQVFIEAAACGTPVVAYDATGMKDSVAPGITGLTAAAGDVADLAACIRRLYQDPDLRRSMRFWARHYVENEYSLMRSYHSLFDVLRRSKLLDCLAMKEKITFQPERVRFSVASSRNGGAALELQMRIAKLEKAIARENKKIHKSPILYALRKKYPRLAQAVKRVKVRIN